MSEAIRELNIIIAEENHEQRRLLFKKWLLSRLVIGNANYTIDRMLYETALTEDAQKRMMEHARISTKRKMAEGMPMDETTEVTNQTIGLHFRTYMITNDPTKKVL
jgi:hypothetical protein